MKLNYSLIPFAVLLGLTLSACSSKPEEEAKEETAPKTTTTTSTVKKSKEPTNPNGGRYMMTSDAEPENLKSVSHVKSAEPHYEPLSRIGNTDYHLRGKDYKIVRSPKGFTETGYASWYGAKFQGYDTSNGETYDMYEMTAAHKTLPLPSYVKVTNQSNGKSVIVRVNDRGPFHDGRVIDLSYAAAYKLGVYQHGTAPVKLEYIDTSTGHPVKQSSDTNLEYLVQVAAISDKDKARSLASSLAQKYSVGAILNTEGGINRVILGPLANDIQADQILRKLRSNGYPEAYIKDREKS